MKSKYIKYENQSNWISKNHKNKNAFTLVELIIVITILAILATIAFISFRSYAWNARDSNKLTTFSNIEKGLSLYQIKAWNYPIPDDVYGSGNYSWALLNQVWYVWANFIQSINMNTIPKDPLVDFKYTYWLSNNKNYYQLWTVLETDAWIIEPQNYVWKNNSKVVWNYSWWYNFSTWWVYYKINLPSLIFTQIWAQNFENAFTDPDFNPEFVINNWGNLVKPYDEDNSESIGITLEKFTKIPGSNLLIEIIPKWICTDFTYSSWGTCQPNNTQTRTILTQSPNNCTWGTPEVLEQSCTYVLTASMITQNVCTQNGQIIYTDELGNKIGELNSNGTTLSWNPENLAQNGYIVACTWNQEWHVLKSVNEWSSTVWTAVASYGNYYQFWKSDTSWESGNSAYGWDWKSPGWLNNGSANDWWVKNDVWTTVTWQASILENKIKMRWPCPLNYHVPTNKEWNNVFNVWVSIH